MSPNTSAPDNATLAGLGSLLPEPALCAGRAPDAGDGRAGDGGRRARLARGL